MINTIMEGPLAVTKTDPETGGSVTNWKYTLINYAARQGPIFTLLLMVLMFLGYCVIYVVPTHLETISKGYEKNATILKESVEILAKSHDRDRELFEKMMLEKRGEK